MKDYSERINEFAEMIKESENVVVFGGAGVSTESGIKDYRSRDGIYSTVKDYGISPEEILSHDFFMQNPSVFYKFYGEYFLGISAKPNAAHTALAKLEKLGKLKAVITQNIDNLHQLGGSRNVIELHGTTRKYHCIKCGADYPFEKVEEQRGKIPYCDECGGLIKPDVTLYGEMLNPDAEHSAIAALSAADMLIVGGTSLVVYPAAAYLNYFGGRHIVLINRDETAFDSNAELIFHENIGGVFKDLMPKIEK